MPSTVNVAASTGAGAGELPVLPGLVDDHAEAVVGVEVGIEVDVVLNISSVSWRSCALPGPAFARGEQRVADGVPVSTTVRVVTSWGRRVAQGVAIEPSSTGSSPMPGAASMRIARTEPSAGRLKLSAVPKPQPAQRRLDLRVLHHRLQLAVGDAELVEHAAQGLP